MSSLVTKLMPRFLLVLVTALSLTVMGCSDQSNEDTAAPPMPAAPDTQVPTTQPTSEGESASLEPYPLDVCIVSGEPLDSMGGEIVLAYEGREIKFCCAGCDTMFLRDPDRYLAKLMPEASSE